MQTKPTRPALLRLFTEPNLRRTPAPAAPAATPEFAALPARHDFLVLCPRPDLAEDCFPAKKPAA